MYANSLLQASKAYNDEYSIDTFANREYGCTKVGYSALLDKKLISDVSLKGVKCGYTVSGKDSSGVVIRKVKNKYYYEVISDEWNKYSRQNFFQPAFTEGHHRF